ncbi:MAG: hypothetical protein HZA84_00350 [Thaumarchaeota archaeon]|nr:hypothetical protein [Nitrososphaerota archaeon]
MKSLRFILKSIILYASLSAAFSIFGMLPIFEQFLPKSYLIGNPLEVSGISIDHVVGHVIFGMIVGVASMRIRYVAIAGLFPIALDADHLIQFLNLEAVPRMAHSVLFGLISIPLMMFFIGKKDYLLGAVSLSAVLAHVSFDILLGGTTSFPLFIPVINKMVSFQEYDWITFLLIAIAVVGITRIVTKNRTIEHKSQET